MKKLLIALVFLFALESCRREPIYILQKQHTTTDTSTKVEIKPRVIYKTITAPADSAALVALVQCDSLNQAYITELSNRPGTRTQIKWRYKIDTLRMYAEVDTAAIIASFIATDTTRTITINRNTTTDTTIQAPPAKQQSPWLIIAGIIAFLIIVGQIRQLFK